MYGMEMWNINFSVAFSRKQKYNVQQHNKIYNAASNPK